MNRLFRSLLLGTLAAGSGSLALADTITASNPGNTLATAQIVPGGASALTDIFGTINNDTSSVQIFQIQLTDGVSFSATTVSNTSNFFDTRGIR